MNPAELDRLARRVNLPIPAEETPMTDTAAARPWDTANNEVTPVRPLRSIAALRPVVDGAIEMLDVAAAVAAEQARRTTRDGDAL